MEGVAVPGGRVSGVGGGDEDRGSGFLTPTKLGLAIFRSSMAPGDGLAVYRDLSGERDMFVFVLLKKKRKLSAVVGSRI